MIFVTVGTQLPFERLVKAIDQWAGEHKEMPVFAQIGLTVYQPKNMEFIEGLSPQAYNEKFTQASLIISHVGMGTIISGLSHAKPMILMPRKAALGEHRNDHQAATARKFSHFNLIDIVDSQDEFFSALNKRLSQQQDYQAEKLEVSANLIAKLQNFIEEVKLQQVQIPQVQIQQVKIRQVNTDA